VNFTRTRLQTRLIGLCTALVLIAGCSSDPAGPVPRIDGVSFARGATGPGVSATNP